ncbi:uncharacterized protein VTP21DRAFT_2303 [Calcarisporiella thermophila]|uniref:uncharacterized protein n=1 Tax=Calcarisporiella thermophila TaxID=911321 RepID=UPI0037440672
MNSSNPASKPAGDLLLGSIRLPPISGLHSSYTPSSPHHYPVQTRTHHTLQHHQQQAIQADSTPSPPTSSTTTTPTRTLPSKHVTESTISQAYIDFILYCNQTVATDVDTGPLMRSFFAVPRSDGKQFHPWALFCLCKRMHEGEIKSWVRLSIELGVERTDDQSPQKIQQYAVRLKRWMRSLHIDSFFDYLLDVPNHYYMLDPSGAPSTGGSASSINNKQEGGEDGEEDADEDGGGEDQVLKLLLQSSPRKKRKSSGFLSRSKRFKTEEKEGSVGGGAEEDDDDDGSVRISEDGRITPASPPIRGSPIVSSPRRVSSLKDLMPQDANTLSPSRSNSIFLPPPPPPPAPPPPPLVHPAVGSLSGEPQRQQLVRRWSDDPWRYLGGAREREQQIIEQVRTSRVRSFPTVGGVGREVRRGSVMMSTIMSSGVSTTGSTAGDDGVVVLTKSPLSRPSSMKEPSTCNTPPPPLAPPPPPPPHASSVSQQSTSVAVAPSSDSSPASEVQLLRAQLAERERELAEKEKLVDTLLRMVEEKEATLQNARRVQQLAIDLLVKGQTRGLL